MAGPTKTYDPGRIFASLVSIPISGYADGTFLTIERMTETFSSVAGAGGEVVRIRSRDKRGKVKFTLLPTSVCNDLLSALAVLDENAGSGIGVFSMSDGNGTTLATSTNAWITKWPAIEQGKEISNREWEIELESLEIFVGGNT